MPDMNTPTTEQRRRFEQLCLLRSLYARRGSRDATAVMPLSEIESYVRALLIDAGWCAGATPAAEPTI